MTVIARDGFGGYSAPPTSGDAPWTATDNTAVRARFEFRGTESVGDKIEWTLHFPEGDLTFQARWSAVGTLLLERISTIPGTSNGTATLQTFTGASTNKPRSTGDLSLMLITVNRGASNGVTAVTFGWRGRGGTSTTAAVSSTFNLDGELTPTSADFAITGSSFRNRPNMDGRTADGDGDPGLAIGTWAKVYGLDAPTTMPVERELWGIESGDIARPQMATFGDCLYALTGTGVDGNQTARGQFSFPAGSVAAGMLGVRVSGTDFGSGGISGYVLFLFADGGSDIFADLYRFDSGTATFLEEWVLSGLLDNTMHEYDLVASDSDFALVVDGIQEPVTVTDATYTTGDPGFGGFRDSEATVGIDGLLFEVDSEGAATPPPNPCSVGIASQDEFTGAADADIDFRATDSFPGVGQWIKHPAADAAIGIDGAGIASVSGTGRAVYRDTAIDTLGDDYCVEVVARFPSVDNPATGTEPFLEPWRYTVTSSGTAIASGLVEDLVGGLHNMGGLQIENLTVHSNGQPATFTIQNTNIFATGVPNPFVSIRFYTRVHSGGGSHTYPLQLDWHMTADPVVIPAGTVGGPGSATHYFGNMGGPYRYAGVNAQNPSNGYLSIVMGPENVWPAHPYPPFYFPRGNPSNDEVFVAGPSSGSGAILEINVGGGGQSGTYDVVYDEIEMDGITPLPSGTPGSHVGEYAYVESLVRWDGLFESGFGAKLIFDHVTPGAINADVELAEYSAGVRTLLRSYPVSVPHGADRTLTLRVATVDGSTVLVPVLNSDILDVFEVATDLADETSALVDDHLTGDPALAAHDASGTGVYLEIEQFTVYGPSDVPCEGPPENPYPEDPPPTDPPPVQQGGEFPMQRGLWRTTVAPSFPMQRGGFRTQAGGAVLTKWVMARGGWRQVVATEVGDEGNDPPPDTIYPPYYDPCELHPPLPVPPGEPLDAPPARLFFAYDLPVTTLGQLFTATPNSTGPWSSGNLAQAAARSGYIIGSQGTYTLYQSGGQYQRSLMQARIDSHGSYYPALMASPWWYGQQVMDDHAARERWNWPTNWTDTDIINEITWIAGYWKTRYPGVRVLIRARAAQFSGSNYPGNVDGIISQYRFWGLGGLTPSAFVSQELSLASSRGWTVLFSVNFENGGLGPSSPYGGSPYTHRIMYELGPGELNAIWEAETVDVSHMHGIGGWKYSAEFINRPGMLDVIAVRRNALAALGPP